MSVQAITDLSAALPFPEGGIASRPILDLAEGTKLVLFALDGGQEISPHAAPFPAEIVALEGTIDVLVGEAWYPLQAHQAIELPVGIPHGVRAQGQARFLLIMRRGALKAAQAREEACAHHGCGHGQAEASAGTRVSHPTLLKWMAEHTEAQQRLDRMEAALRRAQWDEVREGAHWLYTELKAHNEAEETHLFPLMDPLFGGGHGPTACMREEHRLLWDLTVSVLGDITDGQARNPQNSERLGLQLVATLRSHIDKENNVLYPMAERLLSAEALERLGQAMAHA
jgi:hemerythrin-like domain-containing protein/quercetin dioxygenase-like cupin family protein